MKRFAALLRVLDEPVSAAAREDLLVDLFGAIAPADAAWALWLLAGGRLPRLLTPAQLRAAAARAAAVPAWLVEESQRVTGDVAEAAAHVVADEPAAWRDWPLHALLGTRHAALALAAPAERETLLLATWRELADDERVVWNRILLGALRPRIARAALARAVARVLGCSAARVARHLESDWRPTADAWAMLGAEPSTDPLLRPLPLATPVTLDDGAARALPLAALLVEWEQEGERAQIVRRGGEPLLWSRTEELLTPRFPDVVAAAAGLPADSVIDGTVVAWGEGRLLAAALLAQRLARERPTPRLLREAPVAFVALDLLVLAGEDLRARPLRARRAALHEWMERGALLASDSGRRLLLPPPLAPASWDDAEALRARSREHGARGLLLRALDAPYPGTDGAGWWRWEAPALALRAVLLYAERGGGGRGNTYSQLTLGVWDGSELVPVTKLAAALPAAELLELDRWVRRNILAAFGPVRHVRPELVFELEMAAVRRSERHKAGLVLVAPRIARWRRDVRPADADALAAVRRLLPR